jgi:hypothetical protein
MKTKRPFMKRMLLNEVVKRHLFKPNLDIGNFHYSFSIFQYSYYSTRQKHGKIYEKSECF